MLPKVFCFGSADSSVQAQAGALTEDFTARSWRPRLTDRQIRIDHSPTPSSLERTPARMSTEDA
jgi:hypothetical protein